MPGSNILWSVDRRYARQFTGEVLDAVIDRSIVDGETVVREVHTRQVSRMHLSRPDLPDIYVKAYHIPPRKLYRSLVVPYGIKEWRVAQALQKKGIRTCPPVALGIEKRGGLYCRVYFITEAVPDSMTLKEYIDAYGVHGEQGRFAGNASLVDLFADFVAEVRRVGILHSDFHWGNVLITVPEEGRLDFYLIDLHNVLLKPILSERDNYSNLALLNASFQDKIPIRDQLRFMQAYYRDYVHGRRHARDRVKDDTNRLLRRKWKKHDKRCLQENKYFERVARSGLRGFARRDEALKSVLQRLENPEGLFNDPKVRIIKDSRTTSSVAVTDGVPVPGLYVKRYNVKGAWYMVKNLLRASRAKRVWQTANSMRERDIATPLPLLYLERRSLGLLQKCYVVTELVEGAVTLDAYIAGDFQDLGRERKRAFVRMIALQVQKLHQRGVVHGDLKAKNILVRSRPGGGQALCFIDLDAARVQGSVSAAERFRDLARLNCSFLDRRLVSQALRLYFLQVYCGRCSRSELKSAWDLALHYTDRKLRKSARSF